ncbi:MAG: DUF3793 family protein [Oscillospiraceae bacterium]|nr:DUF3793 family protein [Oscillospiraceae bacterium]
MSEELLVRHCAPTMAGIKTAAMFNYHYEDEHSLHESVCAFNKIMVPKGMCMIVLRRQHGTALIYLYRPNMLKSDLSDSLGKSILDERGYPTNNINRCLWRLRDRLSESPEFPHEIGLFLGYPPEDVKGFIDNKAESAKCVGFWKVYGDEKAAEEKFRQYRQCIGSYCKHYSKYHSLERLLVAT